MNKLVIAALTLAPMTAFADIAGPGGGGGCSVASSHPASLAALMVTVGIVALKISRRRK